MSLYILYRLTDSTGPSSVPLAENFTVTYRVTTEWRAIIGKDEKVGDHESRIRLLVFDLERKLHSPCSHIFRG